MENQTNAIVSGGAVDTTQKLTPIQMYDEFCKKIAIEIDSALEPIKERAIEYGKAALEAGEYLLDSYLIEKAKFNSKAADMIGDTLELFGVEGRKRSRRRSKAKDGKPNKCNCIWWCDRYNTEINSYTNV